MVVGLWAVPAGIFLGGLILFVLAPKINLPAGGVGAVPPAADAAAAGATGGKVVDVRASGRSLRTALDVCFLIFVVAATLSIVMYEYRFDPVVQLARIFPIETRSLSEILRRIRTQWPASYFVPPPK